MKAPKWGLALLSLVVVVFLGIETYGQAKGNGADPSKKPKPDAALKHVSRIVNAPGETTLCLVTPQGVQDGTKITISAAPRVIIKMKEEPVRRFQKRIEGLDRATRDRRLRDHQGKIERDHNQLKGFVRQNVKGHKGDFKEYVHLLNGIATRIPEESLDAVRAHPLVEAVYRDVEVSASLAESVPLIGATTLWTTPGATGSGIRVAVIDTGVDYTHPDLGGGFGPSYRVIGGYDFVNNDADPMDDHFHGTHVAGIIGANGTVKGVAPDVSFLAYKVLDANGSGTSSDIIAAIERAVDPDQNPSTDDGAHVISISLGGSGSPDDPMAQAVDNAVQAGVICVVAAANSGPSYFTVMSPGLARKAITVGASDKSDVVASFSSRGPATESWEIKPDVTAPGMAITSTVPGGGYAAYDGTSMATPHVAGLAALLRQLHPTWTTEEMKGVLIQQGKDLGTDVFTQGGGRVQAVDAHNAQAVITPGSVSFGMDDASVAVWTKSETLRIRNLTGTAATYVLTTQGSFPSGVSLTVTPSNVSLAPNASQDVVFSVSVDNTVVPNSTASSYGYEGKLIAASATETLTVPFAFLKAPHINLTFDVPPVYVWIHNRIPWPYSGNFSSWNTDPGNSLSVLIRSNYSYDIVVGYANDPTGAYNPNTRVLREQVAVGTGTVNLAISRSEASNVIALQALDVNNQSVAWDGLYGGTGTWGVDSFLLTNGMTFAPFGILAAGDVPRNALYFSNVSSMYKYNLKVIGLSPQTNWAYYDFAYAFNSGINQSQTTANSTAFKHVTHQHTAPAGVNSLFVVPGIGHADFWYPVSFWRYDSAGMGSVFTPSASDVLTAPFVREAYYSTSSNYWSYHTQFVYQYNGTTFGDGDDPATYSTAWFRAPNTSTIETYSSLYDPTSPDLSTTVTVINHPLGPHGWFSYVYSWGDNGQVKISLTPGMGLYSGQFFKSQYYDDRWSALTYQVFSGSTQIANGTITPGVSPFSIDVPLPSHGVYTLKMPYNDQYSVNGTPANALATATIDTTKPETWAPSLYKLNVLSDGLPSDTTDRSKTSNQIQFGMTDSNLSQVTLSYSAGNRWTQLLSSTSTGILTADVPPDMLTGYYNLKIVGTDTNGNSASYEMTPGLYHKGLNSHLANISTRAYVGIGTSATIGGFIIAGQEPKTVVIRGKGPSLAAAGLTGVLADPYIQLRSGATIVAQNYDWQTDDSLMLSPVIWKGTAADIQAAGLQPLNSKESILLVTLPPGVYTVALRGMNDGVGIGQVGISEVDTYPSSSRLINISTRDYVGTGTSATIGGFIITGTTSQKIVIRGKGPSLAAAGLTGVLADPLIQLRSGATIVAQNYDWQTDDSLMLSPVIWKGTAADIQAAGLQPVDSKESILLVTLPPGVYTVALRGMNDGVGIGQVGISEILE